MVCGDPDVVIVVIVVVVVASVPWKMRK